MQRLARVGRQHRVGRRGDPRVRERLGDRRAARAIDGEQPAHEVDGQLVRLRHARVAVRVHVAARGRQQVDAVPDLVAHLHEVARRERRGGGARAALRVLLLLLVRVARAGAERHASEHERLQTQPERIIHAE